MSAVPKGPWFVKDFRAKELRRMGWIGPSIDRILITDKDSAGVSESSGANCVVARIQMDNRPDELTDQHLADAHLIAAAPELYEALRDMCEIGGEDDGADIITKANAALAKARGER